MNNFARISAAVILLGGQVMAGDCFVGHRTFNHVSHGHATYGHQQQYKVVNHVPQVKVINNLIGVPVPVHYDHLIARQGKTVFGYSNVVGNYADVDLALLFDKAERLASQAQSLSSSATSEYAQLVQTYSNSRANSADIQAAAQAIALVLSQRQQDQATFQTIGQAQSASDWQGVLASRCAQCHDKYNGNAALSDEDWDRILDRVSHAEPSKRMPLASDKASPGEPLSVTELKLLFSH